MSAKVERPRDRLLSMADAGNGSSVNRLGFDERADLVGLSVRLDVPAVAAVLKAIVWPASCAVASIYE